MFINKLLNKNIQLFTNILMSSYKTFKYIIIIFIPPYFIIRQLQYKYEA